MSGFVPPAKSAPLAARAPPARVPLAQRKAQGPGPEPEWRNARCACGGGCPRCQAKVAVSAPGDFFEREADRAADAMAAFPAREAPRAPVASITPLASPAPAEGAVMRAGGDCANGAWADSIASRLDAGTGRGRPLADSARGRMEAGLGSDFSGVRIHDDAGADALSRDLGARAFTHGQDIYFRAGEYNPGTASGDWLLAHELTHVVQQSAARGTGHLVQRASNIFADAWEGAQATARSGASAVGELVDRGVDTVRSAAGTVADVAVETAGAVRDAAVDVARSAQALVEGYLERNAPGVLAFLRGDLVGEIKRRIFQGLDFLFDGLGTRIRTEGLGETMREVFREFTEGLGQIVTDVGHGDCQSLFAAIRMIGRFGERLTGPAFGAFRERAAEIAGFFERIWRQFGAPAAQAIGQLASGAWTWVTEQARWLWAQTAGVRRWLSAAWEEYKRRFNIAWNDAGSLLDDLRRKASEAWEQVKRDLGPWLVPLQVLAGVLLLLSPLGPVIAVGAAGYGLWQAIGWIREHWDDIENMVVRARQALHDHVLGPMMEHLEALGERLEAGREFLATHATRLVHALGQFMDALGLAPFLDAARRVFGLVARQLSRVATFLADLLTRIFAEVRRLALALHRALRPFYGLIAAVILFPQFPFLLPVVLAGWAWLLAPQCIKPPIIDFALRTIIAAVRAMPEFRNFGDAWAQAKAHIIEQLQHALEADFDRKVQIADKIARMMTGQDIEWIGNLVQATRTAPDHFQAQVQQELIGMDLTQPLPFERAAQPSAQGALAAQATTGELSAQELDLLGGRPLTADDVAVDRVAHTTFHPELIEEAGLHRDGETWIGEGGSPHGMDDLRAEMLGAPAPESAAEVGVPAEEGEAQASAQEPALSPEEDTEQRLQQMMQPQEPIPCETQPQPEQTARQETFPEAMKFGPLTQGQRARYMWSQLQQGMAQWWRCNRHWLIPSLILAAVVLIVLEILTEGAITAALPPLMEILAAIMIGVAAVRVAYYIGEYLVKAIANDVAGSAKALARGLAVGAIEVVFALVFNIGAVIKSVREGARASARALAQAARRTVTGTIEAVQTLGRTLGRGGRALVGSTRRIAGAALRQGRLVLEGVSDGVARGARSLSELLRRLRRFRFRGFSLERRGHWFMLWGHFNPKVLLATGEIEEASLVGTGVRPMLGMRATGVSGRRGIVIGVRDTSESAFIAGLRSGDEDLEALYRQLSRMSEAERRAAITGMGQTAEHARQLRAAMLEGGIRPGRGAPGGGNAAHHIVPSTSTYSSADEARQLLDDLGIHFNDRLNGVFVPPAIHGPLHTQRYMDAVLDALTAANRPPNARAKVIAALDDIADRILRGQMTH